MNQLKVLNQGIDTGMTSCTNEADDRSLLQHPGPQLCNSRIYLGVFHIYVIDSGLQKGVHIGKFLTVSCA